MPCDPPTGLSQRVRRHKHTRWALPTKFPWNNASYYYLGNHAPPRWGYAYTYVTVGTLAGPPSNKFPRRKPMLLLYRKSCASPKELRQLLRRRRHTRWAPFHSVSIKQCFLFLFWKPCDPPTGRRQLVRRRRHNRCAPVPPSFHGTMLPISI